MAKTIAKIESKHSYEISGKIEQVTTKCFALIAMKNRVTTPDKFFSDLSHACLGKDGLEVLFPSLESAIQSVNEQNFKVTIL